MSRNLTATVSGSFHRHIDEIEEAVKYLGDVGVKVLSPEDPTVVDSEGPFLFVASDRHRAVRLVQDRHLAAISRSDFVWLICPDGYVGSSAALEIGFAISSGIPVLSTSVPQDLTMREYVRVVPSLAEAVNEARISPNSHSRRPSILISPDEVVAEANRSLEELRRLLTGRAGVADGSLLTMQVHTVLDDLGEALGLARGSL